MKARNSYSPGPFAAQFGSQVTLGTFTPNKVFAVLALEEIASLGAVTALTQAADSYSDPQIRGVALNAVAKTYYQRVRQDNLTPPKDIVAVLVRVADDRTYIPYIEKTVSQIAQDGITEWVGLDFGDPQFREERMGFTPAEYGREWW